MIKVNPNRCPQDHRCPMIPGCPKNAISQVGVGLPQVDNSKCIICMYCVQNCPKGAFEITED